MLQVCSNLTQVLIVAKCIVNQEMQEALDIGLKVLIVAKCIVNVFETPRLTTISLGINSSKVYCK